MAFRFKQGESIESAARRLACKQLDLASARLVRVGDRKSDREVHEARRHIKKVRALIRLLRPALAGDRNSYKRLRAANHLLAPIADGEAVFTTLARLATLYREDLPRQTVAALRRGLIGRWSRLDGHAVASHALPATLGLLRAERRRVRRWRLKERGFAAVARGFRKSVRDARRAMARASAHPTVDNFHAWRRRTKDHWLQVRLLEGRCGDSLADSRRALEALDGHLGEYHNCALLQRTLVTDTMLPRGERARCLRVLRRYQKALRAEAAPIGASIYKETPRQFVSRVERLWRSAKAATPAGEKPSWPRAA